MLDKATVLVTIFTIVDDVMKASPAIQRALCRPGPNPNLSDSEVVTLALYQELIGEPREDHFFRLHQASLLPYFPNLNERSRYNRRKRDLWSVIVAMRLSLQVVIDGLQYATTAGIDSAPVVAMGYRRDKTNSAFPGFADYGVCTAKALKYFGCKLHSVVSLTGCILGYLLTPASPYDNKPVAELIDSMAHHLKWLLGDKAYTDFDLMAYLKHYHALELLAPAKSSHHPLRSRRAQFHLNQMRLICETVNAQLQEQLHLSKHYAKSIWGCRKLTRYLTF